jgi:hypothetical protein
MNAFANAPNPAAPNPPSSDARDVSHDPFPAGICRGQHVYPEPRRVAPLPGEVITDVIPSNVVIPSLPP